ncbi:hypothetical protein TNCV_2930171 [Trichonephila clavipes]|nr:hypothetical protein TNCV_2930171 [Trichonephila clavipes]
MYFDNVDVSMILNRDPGLKEERLFEPLIIRWHTAPSASAQDFDVVEASNESISPSCWAQDDARPGISTDHARRGNSDCGTAINSILTKIMTTLSAYLRTINPHSSVFNMLYYG